MSDQPADATPIAPLSRRGFLTAAAVASGGLVAVGLGACTPGGGPSWSYMPGPPHLAAASAGATAGTPATSHGSSPAPSAAASASAPIDHDANADGRGQAVPRRRGQRHCRPGNQPLEPTLDGDDQGIRAHDRPDPAPHRRAQGADRGPRLQRDVAGTAADRHRGRHGPGDLHQQPGRVDRHPLPRPAAAERDGRRPAHHPGTDPAG